jgi:tRNA(Ile)-lysidine synthase
LNHTLRPEAGQEADMVAHTARERGLQFVLGEDDTHLYAHTHSLSIEEAARTLRYRFLFEQARLYEAQAVAVAHTADDQVETVLMHFLRGAGVAGLTGMANWTLPNAWSLEIPLVRPLLRVWREQILAYCAEKRLLPVYDSSNQDLTYFRNRLRQELIPYLEGFNPAIKRIIWRNSEVMRGENEIIHKVVEETMQDCVQRSGEGFVVFNASILSSQPAGMQRRIIRRAISDLRPGLRDVGFEAIDRAMKFLASSEKPDQIDLVSNLRLVFETGNIWLTDRKVELPTDDWPQMSDKTVIQIIEGGVIKLIGNWQLQVELVSDAEIAWEKVIGNQDPWQAWLAVNIDSEVLYLRTIRPGDHIQPMGMSNGTQKLTDFMIDHKLPRRARHGWPLIFVGDKIAWVPGYRLGQSFQLSPATQWAIHLTLKKFNN